MPFLMPQDHPGAQDRSGASTGKPSPGAPGPSGCQYWGTQSFRPGLGALGREGKGREGWEGRKEGKGRGRKWMSALAPRTSLVPSPGAQDRLGASPRALSTGALGLGQVPQDHPGVSPGAPAPSACTRKGGKGRKGKKGKNGHKGRGERRERRERKGKEGEGTGCQSWCPMTILVPSPGAPGPSGFHSWAPSPGASPGEPSPATPGLGALGKEGMGRKEGKGTQGKKRNE